MNMFRILISIWVLTGLSLWGGDFLASQSSQKGWADAVTFDYGQSQDHIDIYRFGLRKDFSAKWWESDTGYLSGYWEASLNYWNGYGNENFGLALSPVFTYFFHHFGNLHPYLEGGIGGSLWTRVRMGPRDLSSAFLFEDRAGAGVRIGNWDLNLRYMHYSNAEIVKPNDGIDILIASFTYRF